MQGDFPATKLRILNANKGVTNVIEQNVINTDLKRVTDNLFQVLRHHYGPFSGFAAIDDGQPLNETQFTKDGIGIIRAISFVSPQEEWVRKTIAYIGTRMEASVGDGTTSAMMFTCAMLRHMSEHINEIKPISYHQFTTCWDEYRKLVKDRISYHYTFYPTIINNDYKSGIDEEKVAKIVYNQVYTSSHGDKELSKALSDMYKFTPKEQWERMTYERCTYETDKNYEVVKSEGEYTMNAKPMATSMLNKDLCTWFERDNVTLVVINDSFRSDSPDWPVIMHHVDTATEANPVVVVCHQVMDRESYRQINDKVTKCDKEGKPFAVFTLKPEHPTVNDFVALQLIACQDIMRFSNGEALIIKGAHVKYKQQKLFIDKIVPDEPEGWSSNERHHVTDGKHAQFTDSLEAWQKQAENYTRQAMTNEDREIANYFCRMYLKLRYKTNCTIVVGGKAYDNIAFVDVLDDAIKAASRALSNGATLGNNRALYLASRRIVDELTLQHGDNPEHKIKDPTYRTIVWLANRVIESLEDIANVVIDRVYPGKRFFKFQRRDFIKWWFTHPVDILQYDSSPSHKLCPWRGQFSKFSFDLNYDATTRYNLNQLFSGDGFICQPANSDSIMLERFGEVALKFILTERVVIRDGAYVDKKKK